MVEFFQGLTDEDKNDVMVRSNCDDEQTFRNEFSKAFASFMVKNPTANGTATNLMGLFVDICCKYRGYKTEGVTEKKVYMAGQGVPFGPATYAVQDDELYTSTDK
jgi:hypothetical protein